MKNKETITTGQTQSVDVKKISEQELERKDQDRKRLITAIIPLRGSTTREIDQNETLIRKCAEAINESKWINKVVISADDLQFEPLTQRFRNASFMHRPPHLSEPDRRVIDVLKYTLGELESTGETPDMLIPTEITYPFRPKGIFDRVIEMYLDSEYDTVIAGFAEYRVCWREEEITYTSITDLSLPRKRRTPLFVGLPGLACAVSPDVIRQGKRYGEQLGILQVDDPLATVEVRTREQLKPLSDTFYWPE